MSFWLILRVKMPPTRIVGAKSAFSVLNPYERRGARVFVEIGFDEASNEQIDP